MINFDDYANKNKTEHNLKWPYIPDRSQRLLIIGGSGSGKTNGLLNLFVQDFYEPKYQFLINKRESIGIKYFNNM